MHAAPPFTIFTTTKIYDLSPQMSVTQNVTFQPQEKHTATKYGQQRHGTINANWGKKRLPFVVYSAKFRKDNQKASPSPILPTQYSNEHTYTFFTVASCMLPHLLYNPTQALFTL
jgi:hypothetical protein